MNIRKYCSSLCLLLVFVATAKAQADLKTILKDFQKISGSWKGSLTYLDYSSGKPYTMPADMEISRIGTTNTFAWAHRYPNEPGANSIDTVVLTPDGKYIDRARIRTRRVLPNGDVEVITEETGTDGNDNRPATFRHTYVLGKDLFTKRKDVRFAGESKWINRHEYRYTRTSSAQKPRARDLGIPFNGTPGTYNAITDVKGVEVGYTTLISGKGTNVRGKGPVRTGVTAILPRGRTNNPVYANFYSLNGNGEMTGTTWITESGFLETPIMITNTNSVGVVRDAVLKWFVRTGWYKDDFWYTYPVVAETYDGFLNDIYGFHVKEEHAYQALDSARGGFLQEGNVGGGTGMMCLGFKGGTGTSSRVVKIGDSTYTVGVLVQSNFGSKRNFTIAGVPVGRELKDTLNYEFKAPPSYQPGDGSIIVVVATDAPLLPHQLKRIAARVPLGVGIVGGRGENGSGDIFLAFSTANAAAFQRKDFTRVDQLPNDGINPLFDATVQAVEEAIINAMVAAETMEGINGNKAYRLPHQLVIDILKKYKRIS